MDSNEAVGEFSKVAEEFKAYDAQMRNPLVVGALLNRLAQERESTNRLMHEINAKLDRIVALEEKVRTLESKLASKPVPVTEHAAMNQTVLLPEVDEKIMDFVARNGGRVCAAQVQKEFNYRGRNAASSRLHALFLQGVLEKRQVGKNVFYLLPDSRVTERNALQQG
jgi:aspartokinase